jgi:hypothetical protein
MLENIRTSEVPLRIIKTTLLTTLRKGTLLLKVKLGVVLPTVVMRAVF